MEGEAFQVKILHPVIQGNRLCVEVQIRLCPAVAHADGTEGCPQIGRLDTHITLGRFDMNKGIVAGTRRHHQVFQFAILIDPVALRRPDIIGLIREPGLGAILDIIDSRPAHLNIIGVVLPDHVDELNERDKFRPTQALVAQNLLVEISQKVWECDSRPDRAVIEQEAIGAPQKIGLGQLHQLDTINFTNLVMALLLSEYSRQVQMTEYPQKQPRVTLLGWGNVGTEQFLLQSLLRDNCLRNNECLVLTDQV